MKTFLTIFVLFIAGGCFAQNNNQVQKKEAIVLQNNNHVSPTKKDIYMPIMTKEQRVNKINNELIKQAEIKNNESNVDKKNAVLNNEKEINPVTFEKLQNNVKLMKIENKEINSTETEKVNLIENKEPDKK